MIADIATVVWKEWRELTTLRGSLRGGLRGLLVSLGVFGIYLPLQFGRSWMDSPTGLLLWMWVPLVLVVSVIADAIAGERERHTLETLLASRLPDRAILLGKVAAAALYGWGFVVASLLLGLITVNVAFRDDGQILIPAGTLAAILGLSLLAAALAAAAGVLVSLRSPTVRQASQTMSVVIMLLVFAPVLGSRALPDEWKARLAEWFLNASMAQWSLAAAAVLTLFDVGLLAAAMARFQRSRLSLD